MIAVNSQENLRPESAETSPSHWLAGRYFVPLPDLSDETRKAIYAGRAAAAWIEITSRLHTLERRGADRKAAPEEQARQQARQQAAFSGRIEGLGVNGLAVALGCSHTTALKYVRYLESLGLIRTEQGEFTAEVDQVTGKIRRNYAKSPPKVIIVTIQDRHLRPCLTSQTRRGGTPETGLNPNSRTPETGGKGPSSPARNWRHSREPNLQRGSVPMEPNRRRTAAGPLGRPAAAAATAEQKQSAAHDPKAAWQTQADEAARERGRQAMAEHLAAGLQMNVIEVIALWKAQPDELKRQAVEAGLLTPEGKLIRQRPYANRIRRFPPAGTPLQSEPITNEELGDFLRRLKEDQKAKESASRSSREAAADAESERLFAEFQASRKYVREQMEQEEREQQEQAGELHPAAG